MWRRQRTFQGSGLLNPAYRFLGATAIQASGTFPGNNYVGADSTDATYTPGTRIGPRLFATTEYEGSALDVLVRNDGDGRGRIYVDGREVKRWVPADFTAASITSGNIGRFSLTFTAAKRRRISIAPDNPASWIIGLDVQPGKPIFFPTSNTKGPRVMIAGDSFGEGTGASAGDPNMVQWLQWHMGWDDIWNTSSGGTGYFADGPRTSLSDRYVNDIIDLAPNTVIIPLGINDQTLWGSNLAGTQAAMQTVWDGIRTALPSAEIVVVGPWPNNGGVGVTAALIAIDAWMQAQCATRGIQFISPIQDGVTFVTSDGVHPDSAGHELLGAWLAGRLSLPYTR
jgi:lysophospholipase L1-like esterase